jgi:hypothetical protein
LFALAGASLVVPAFSLTQDAQEDHKEPIANTPKKDDEASYPVSQKDLEGALEGHLHGHGHGHHSDMDHQMRNRSIAH